MKRPLSRPLGACLIALATLSACGESQQDLDAARKMRCTELAREIGKREQRRDSARVDGVINTITSVVADDKEVRDAADIDSAINSIDEYDADTSLDQLEKIYRAKGCR